MLVLSRKVGEQITIGDNVVVTVQRIGGNRVSIAVTAPKDVPVWRGEVMRIRRERTLSFPTWPDSGRIKLAEMESAMA